MKISEYAVKNYQFTLIMFLMAVALGVTTLLTMPRSEDPEIEAPQFSVIVVYPGTSPEDMEELVVDPLEEKDTRAGRHEAHPHRNKRRPRRVACRI